MNGYQYEQKCAKLLEAKGFSNVQVTRKSGDHGIDIIAYQSEKKYGVQCKYYESNVGKKAIQEVYAGASYYKCTNALVITNSKLTKPAKEFARELNVQIWENIDAIYLQKHTTRNEQKRTVPKSKKRDQERQKLKELAYNVKEMPKNINPVYHQNYTTENTLNKINAQELKELKTKQREEAKKVAKLRPIYDYAAGLIACSKIHIVVVKSDGTVVATMRNDVKHHYCDYGQCNVSEWRDVIAVYCNDNETFGITSKGTVYYTGKDQSTGVVCSRWKEIQSIAFTNYAIFGLKYNGTVVSYHRSPEMAEIEGYAPVTWSGITQLRFSHNSIMGITRDQKLLHVKKTKQNPRYQPTSFNDTQNVVDAAIDDSSINHYFTDCVVLKTDGTVSISKFNNYGPTLENQYGIIKIYFLGANNPIAILSDGSIFTGYNYNSFTKFLDDHKIKNNFRITNEFEIIKVIAICVHKHCVAILTENGKIYWYTGNTILRENGKSYTYSDYKPNTQPFGDEFRAFSNFSDILYKKKIIDEKINHYKEVQREAEEAQRETELKIHLTEERRNKGLCLYCGGSLKNGFLYMKCTSCGKKVYKHRYI